MKIRDEFANRVSSSYVEDDYLQVMLGYQNNLLLFGNKKLMYFKNYNEEVPSLVEGTKNLYLEDARRNHFPYSSIPEHTRRVLLFRKVNYVNQIFDFEEPYIRIYDGFIAKMTAFKDRDGAVVHTKFLNGKLCDPRTKTITREELENYLKTGSLDHLDEEEYEGTCIFDNNGSVYNSELPSEQNWINSEKARLSKIIIDSDEYKDCTKKELLKAISTLDTIEPFYIITRKMMIKFKANGEIKIESFAVKFLKQDKYEIVIADLPVTKESLSMIKSRPELPIMKASEPRISLLLNPNVAKEQLQEEKDKVLVRKK